MMLILSVCHLNILDNEADGITSSPFKFAAVLTSQAYTASTGDSCKHDFIISRTC